MLWEFRGKFDQPNKMIPETISVKINYMGNKINELAITKGKPNCLPEQIRALKKFEKKPQYHHQKNQIKAQL